MDEEIATIAAYASPADPSGTAPSTGSTNVERTPCRVRSSRLASAAPIASRTSGIVITGEDSWACSASSDRGRPKNVRNTSRPMYSAEMSAPTTPRMNSHVCPVLFATSRISSLAKNPESG